MRRPRPAPIASRMPISRWRADGAREQHAGDVRAGDDEHEADGWHRRRRRATEQRVGFRVQPRVARRPDGDAPVLVRLRIARPQVERRRPATLARACSTSLPGSSRALTKSHRCPRRSSRDVPVGDGTDSLMPAGSTSSAKRTGTQSSGASIGTMAGERVVGDADDRERLSANAERLADPPSIAAELALPEPVRQHHVTRRDGVVVGGRSVRPSRAGTPSVVK